MKSFKEKFYLNPINKNNTIPLLFLIFCLSSFTFANIKTKDNENDAFKAEIREEYLKLPDPFKKRTKDPKKTVGKSYKTIMINNSYTNIPKLNKTSLDSIRIVGIILGKKRLAQAKIVARKGGGGTGDTLYDLREGMKIGENDSEIKAILPGGIVVVEKIKNIYNEDEHIETIIPLIGDI